MAKSYKESNGLFDREVSVMSDREFSEWLHRYGVQLPNGWWTHKGDGGVRGDAITDALERLDAISTLPGDIAKQTVGTGRGRRTHQQIQDRECTFVQRVLRRLDTLEDRQTRELCAAALQAGRALSLCEVRAKSGLYKGRHRSLKGFRKGGIRPEAVRDAIEQIRLADPNLTKTQAVRQVAAEMGVGERRVWTLLSKAEH